jgi:tetratricopeptide (TPR) repeat protein
VGSGLMFYAVYSIGNYALLSWLGAAACVGTVALLLRRGSWVTAALAILVVPRIALRTIPRAEIFSVVLFAAFLTLLWEHYETGRSRLWLLPLMMVAWVNLHLGLTAGLGLLIGYVLLECGEMIWQEHRQRAIDNLRRAWPWFLATIAATLVNPWGWGAFAATRNLMTPMTNRTLLIDEWGPVRLEWMGFVSGLSLHNYDSTVILVLAVVVAVPLALVRRQVAAAIWLCGAAFLGLRHGRLLIFFAILVVVIAGSVFNSALASLQARISDARTYSILIGGVCCLIVVAACIWSTDLVTSRSYMRRAGTYGMGSFGTGLSWWFPEGAAAFIEREKIPAQLFNTYLEGGYLVWRLGQNYKDYVDGRGGPFGSELILRGFELTQTPPDSPGWQREAEHYDINAIIVPLARYWGVEHFPLLRQFCVSNNWRPVYLDETSAVFVRHTSATESLVARLQINCDTAPIPAIVPTQNDAKSFNRWANAAAVLNALGRTREALTATSKAIAIFPDSGSLRFTRADLLEKLGDLHGAEQEYLASANLAPDPANWTHLAKLYEQEHKIPQAIAAWTREVELSTDHAFVPLLSLGFEYLNANQPREALNAFGRSQASFQKENGSGIELHEPFYATLAHGRAMATRALGDIKAAIALEEEAVQLAPERQDDWLELGALYDLQGRPGDADRARKRALEISVQQSSGEREDD